MVSLDNFSDLPINKLQIIPFDRLPGRLNMAIDHTMSENCQLQAVPVLRFYGWDPFCVSIGYHQKEELIDFDKLNQSGIDFVKRPTGGRAIYHAEELTYSLICPRKSMDHKQLYHFFHQIFANALISLGYPVQLKTDNEKLAGLTHQANDFPCFIKSAQTEVQFGEMKLIGSAQKLYDQAILQHGSLLIGEKHQQLADFLKVSDKTKKMIEADIRAKTICLEQIKKEPISQEKIINSIINQLELVSGISVNSRTLSPEEMANAYEENNRMSFPLSRE